jgi:hypothetical protein
MRMGSYLRKRIRQGTAAIHYFVAIGLLLRGAYIRLTALPAVSLKPDITKVCRTLQKCHQPGRAPVKVSLSLQKSHLA